MSLRQAKIEKKTYISSIQPSSMSTISQTYKSDVQRLTPVVVDALQRGSAAYEAGVYPLTISIFEKLPTEHHAQCFLGLINAHFQVPLCSPTPERIP